MTEPRALEYRLLMDGETIPFGGSITVGRHLDNDVVIAGEDVLDFHLRIDLTQRGPIVVPLGAATVQLNDRLLELPAGLLPGDRVEVGASVLELGADAVDPPDAEAWRLCPPGDPEGLPVAEMLRIGREPASDLRLTDPHTSRRHAVIVAIGGSIWVQDLDSANGTYINGERIRGSRRLFHGDEVRFDQFVCQLLGRGADLTPSRGTEPRDRQSFSPRRTGQGRPEGGDTLEFAAVPRSPPASPARPATLAAGSYLVVPGTLPGLGWHRLPMGRTVIGRNAECEVLLRDRTVSGLHAEVILRPEGAMVTDLMSTNGTLCNGRRVQSVKLRDGDRLQVGRGDLEFREVAPDRVGSYRLRRLVAVALVLAAGTAVLLWL